MPEPSPSLLPAGAAPEQLPLPPLLQPPSLLGLPSSPRARRRRRPAATCPGRCRPGEPAPIPSPPNRRPPTRTGRTRMTPAVRRLVRQHGSTSPRSAEAVPAGASRATTCSHSSNPERLPQQPRTRRPPPWPSQRGWPSLPLHRPPRSRPRWPRPLRPPPAAPPAPAPAAAAAAPAPAYAARHRSPPPPAAM